LDGNKQVVFEDAHLQPHRLYWSRIDENIAIIETRHGAYLWDVASDTRTLITDVTNSEGQSFLPDRNFQFPITYYGPFAWDFERERFYAITVAAPFGVTAFDAHTGRQVAFYGSGGDIPSSLEFNTDENHLIVSSYAYNEHREGHLTVWNLDTNQGTEVRILWPTSTLNRAEIRLSPDGRFLVILRHTLDGMRNIAYVWDLSALPGNIQDRLPLYTLEVYKGATMHSGIFLDSHTIYLYIYSRCLLDWCYDDYQFDVNTGIVTFLETKKRGY